MKKLNSILAGVAAFLLLAQCSNDDSAFDVRPAGVAPSAPLQQSLVTETSLNGTPRLNKPCIDPGNVFNQTFQPGDTLFVNGVDLGVDQQVSTMDLIGVGGVVASLPLNIEAPYQRGSFVIPISTLQGSYYVKLRIGGVLTSTHSENFNVN